MSDFSKPQPYSFVVAFEAPCETCQSLGEQLRRFGAVEVLPNVWCGNVPLHVLPNRPEAITNSLCDRIDQGKDRLALFAFEGGMHNIQVRGPGMPEILKHLNLANMRIETP